MESMGRQIEAYLRRGQDEGWIKKSPGITMNKIIVDHSYQSREVKCNREHQKYLAQVRDNKDGDYLDPIIVFLITDSDGATRFLLVDGFHRYNENLQRHETSVSIPAYVIERDDWRSEAIFVATMCNQHTMLPHSPEDKRRCIRMLLSNEAFAGWKDSRIARHIGFSTGLVRDERLKYAKAHGKDIPAARPKVRRGQPALALVPHDEHDPSEYEHPPLRTTRAFKDWALGHGVILESPPYLMAGFRMHGLISGDTVIVLCNSVAVNDLYEAYGRASLLAALSGLAEPVRPVVVTVEQEGLVNNTIIEKARTRGVEFMTPWDLIDRIKRDVHSEVLAQQE